MQNIRSLLAVALGATVLAFPLRGADTKPDAPKPVDAKAADSDKADGDKASPKEEEPVLSVTAHSVAVDGKVINYHATAGYMLVKVEEGKPLPTTQRGRGHDGDAAADAAKDDAPKFRDGVKPVAKVFFIAYTLDDVTDPSKRPVTFLFNGGPGSSSLWLHMGSVAPRRAALTDDGESTPPPYGITDNRSTWLDKTDLVFIDPVSTGFSRPESKEDLKQFHGLKEDIASVGEFIRLYTTRNTRWLSPKFIMGESYGTTRAAGLADYLQNRYGLYLNGLILVSSALEYQTFIFSPQNLDPYIYYLPSFATAAWYHHKLSAAMEAKSVSEIAAEARLFAAGEYSAALHAGDTLPEAQKAHVADELSRFTGIPAADYRLLNLKMTDALFATKLLFNERRYLGEYDARFTGVSYTPGDTEAANFYDPSMEAVEAPMTAAFNDYIRRELKYESDLPYEDLLDVSPWNWGDPENGFPNTAENLRQVMTRNPYLKVWITCSYFDLSTPFFAAENVVAGLNLDPSIRPNLRMTYYEAGHMLYIRSQAQAKLKADFLSFLNDATNQPVLRTAAP
jgi:carboxypeptidase C (cathepsin A)